MIDGFKYSVRVDMPYFLQNLPIAVWLRENIGEFKTHWHVYRGDGPRWDEPDHCLTFCFNESQHAVLFKLSWGGE